MSNYTQTNIYRKQMQRLGLNTEQYAKLIDIPYEIVKDIIYDKEGDYNMDIKNLLRRNMVEKHQEVENNFENAKIKAMEIKKDSIDYLNWYENEYNVDMLKEKLNVSGPTDFERYYEIKVNNKKASHWFYSVLCAKTEYKNHGLQKDKKLEFVKQLYDILVNGNKENYYKEYNKVNTITNKQYYNKDGIKNVDKYIKWYNNFNVLNYMKENGLTNVVLSKELNIAYSTFCQLSSKTHASLRAIKKLYDYVQEHTKVNESVNDTVKPLEETEEKIEVLEINDDTTSELKSEIDTKTSVESLANAYKNVIERNNTGDLLRKILVNRLTEEEKMLIELFGGKIE